METINVPRSVTVMAVTKGVSIERIIPVLQKANITLIGESRWQEAKDKLRFLPEHIEKHFIGHLQTNKAKEVVESFDCIESVDGLKLANAINSAAIKQNKIMPIYLQINISADPNKHGILVNDVDATLQHIKLLGHIVVKGLMTITADDQSDEETRADFRRMKQLQLRYGLPELSMGMSNDWQIAVEEGATIVRLGRTLFTRTI